MEDEKKREEFIPGYLISKKLGAGGTSAVFKAKNVKTNQEVAIKILYPRFSSNAVFVAQFIREAQLLIKLQHPHIVKGYSFSKVSNLYYLIMELVEGETLSNIIIKHKRLEETYALKITIQIASALDYLESHNLIHRDIKPENVIITPSNVAKLIDLGFAKVVRTKVSYRDDDDVTCGTPDYMSPEQIKGLSSIDIRADIYSLGATLYHMVIGETPFQGTDNLEIMRKQVLENLSTDKTKAGLISPLMHYFIEKMMAKDKDIRYQSPKELIQDIKAKLSFYKEIEEEKKSEELRKMLEESSQKEKLEKRKSSSIYFSKKRINKLLGRKEEQ